MPRCADRLHGPHDRHLQRLAAALAPELASLIDPAQANPALPTGNPFHIIQSAGYWSETTSVVSSIAWTVDFGNGVVGTSSAAALYFWCVRGWHECGCVLRIG